MIRIFKAAWIIDSEQCTKFVEGIAPPPQKASRLPTLQAGRKGGLTPHKRSILKVRKYLAFIARSDASLVV